MQDTVCGNPKFTIRRLGLGHGSHVIVVEPDYKFLNFPEEKFRFGNYVLFPAAPGNYLPIQRETIKDQPAAAVKVSQTEIVLCMREVTHDGPPRSLPPSSSDHHHLSKEVRMPRISSTAARTPKVCVFALFQSRPVPNLLRSLSRVHCAENRDTFVRLVALAELTAEKYHFCSCPSCRSGTFARSAGPSASENIRNRDWESP